MASSRRYAEDAAELEAFERTLKNRIHSVQGLSKKDSEVSWTCLGIEVKELQSNFDSYLRLAHEAAHQREREAQRIKQENEDLKLEVLTMKRQVSRMTMEMADLREEILGGPRLPMELLTVVAQFLAGTNSFRTLANFNVASKGLRRETKQIMNETILMDARNYWWFQKLNPNSKLEDITQHTTESQREAWRQAKFVVTRRTDCNGSYDLEETIFQENSSSFPNLSAVLVYGGDQEEYLHIRRPVSRYVLSDYLNIPLHQYCPSPRPVILRDIYIEKKGSITGPILTKDEYWIGTSSQYMEACPNIRFDIENVVTMCHTLKHLNSMFPPLEVRTKQEAEQCLPASDSHGYAAQLRNPPVWYYHLNGSIDCLIRFFDTIEEVILCNLDIEHLVVECADINCFDKKRYLAIIKCFSEVFKRLWTAGARTTLELTVDHCVNFPPAEAHADSGWTNTYLEPMDTEEGFFMETTFESLNGEETEYPEATETFTLSASLMDES